MAVINDIIQIIPVEFKNEFTIPLKKRVLLRTVKNLNIPTKKNQVSKGCHNCSHHLSKYYYWKQSPCDGCSRSPMNYYRFSRIDIPDNWEAIINSSALRKNVLRS